MWPKGSLEEVVQNLVKTWEMELSHKTRVSDFKSIDHEKFCISVNGKIDWSPHPNIQYHLPCDGDIQNVLQVTYASTFSLRRAREVQYVTHCSASLCAHAGGPKFSAAETLEVGSYNALMATSSFQGEEAKYQAAKETFESSHEIFRTVFPGGFAWEVLAVYSPPPVVVMKYRHWGVMEGGYKGHAPTGEVVESIGIVVAKVSNLPPRKWIHLLASFSALFLVPNLSFGMPIERILFPWTRTSVFFFGLVS